MDTNINHTECREALISGGGGGGKVEGDMTGEKEVGVVGGGICCHETGYTVKPVKSVKR